MQGLNKRELNKLGHCKAQVYHPFSYNQLYKLVHCKVRPYRQISYNLFFLNINIYHIFHGLFYYCNYNCNCNSYYQKNDLSLMNKNAFSHIYHHPYNQGLDNCYLDIWAYSLVMELHRLMHRAMELHRGLGNYFGQILMNWQ